MHEHIVMALLSANFIKGRLSDGECINCGQKLAPGENGISRDAIPGLYGGKLGQGHKENLGNILSALLENSGEVRGWPSEARFKLKGFLSRAVNCEPPIDEKFLHAYLYFFWTEVSAQIDRPELKGDCFFLGRGSVLDGDLSTGERSHYLKTLLEKLVKLAQVDLVVVNEHHGCMYIIDVKRESIDDRSVGQMLRYYNAAAEIVYRGDRVLNISYVKPMLFIGSDKAFNATGFPQYFFEIIDVYSFRFIEEGPDLQFHNMRRQMISAKDVRAAR